MIQFRPMVRGWPHSLRLTVKNRTTGQVVDITGWRAQMGLARSRNNLGALLALDTDIADGADGVVVFDLLPDLTAAILDANVIIDIQLAPPATELKPVAVGFCRMLSEQEYRAQVAGLKVVDVKQVIQSEIGEVTINLDYTTDPDTDLTVLVDISVPDTGSAVDTEAIALLTAEIAALKPSFFERLLRDPQLRDLYYPHFTRATWAGPGAVGSGYGQTRLSNTESFMNYAGFEDGVLVLGASAAAGKSSFGAYVSLYGVHGFIKDQHGLLNASSFMVMYIPDVDSFPDLSGYYPEVLDGFGWHAGKLYWDTDDLPAGTPVFQFTVAIGGHWTGIYSVPVSSVRPHLQAGWNYVCVKATQDSLDQEYIDITVIINGDLFATRRDVDRPISTMLSNNSIGSGLHIDSSFGLALYALSNRNLSVSDCEALFAEFKQEHGLP